jgi:imidazolonepropionase-like amidohydrolase
VILVDGNPLENISDIRKVTAVFAGGKMFQPAQLWPLVGFKP